MLDRNVGISDDDIGRVPSILSRVSLFLIKTAGVTLASTLTALAYIAVPVSIVATIAIFLAPIWLPSLILVEWLSQPR